MITREFDDLKKIWDVQNNEPLYAIDEKALYGRIQSKMNTTLRLTNITDWVLILINLGVVITLLVLNPVKPGVNLFIYVEAAWILATVVYFVISHIRRMKAGRRFDRSVHGDLDHAIFLASYQMRIAQIIRWNLLPLGALMIYGGWEAGKLLKVSIVVLVAHTLAFYVSSWGYGTNKKRKQELLVLKEKLESSH